MWNSKYLDWDENSRKAVSQAIVDLNILLENRKDYLPHYAYFDRGSSKPAKEQIIDIIKYCSDLKNYLKETDNKVYKTEKKVRWLELNGMEIKELNIKELCEDKTYLIESVDETVAGYILTYKFSDKESNTEFTYKVLRPFNEVVKEENSSRISYPIFEDSQMRTFSGIVGILYEAFPEFYGIWNIKRD